MALWVYYLRFFSIRFSVESPTTRLGDFIPTNRAFPALFLPHSHELLSLSHIVEHFRTLAFFKVHLPFRCIWIRFPLYLNMPYNLRAVSPIEFQYLPVLFRRKYPVPSVNYFEVFILYPVFALLWMASGAPFP